jgi:fibronectin-binding autotransporter adhesin
LQFAAAFDISTRSVLISAGGATFDTNQNDLVFANGFGENGTGGLTKIGQGALSLAGANSYGGVTLVNAGSLVLQNSNALENSTLNTSGSGSIVFDSSVTSNSFVLGGLQGTGNLSLVNNAASPTPIALTVGGNNQSTNYGGSLSGGATLTKIGTGSLILTGNNAYTGGTFFNGGTINASSLANLGSGGLTFNGGTLQFGAAFDISTRPVVINSAGATWDTNGNNVTFANPIGASNQPLIVAKVGAGTLELDGGLAMGDASALQVSAGSLVLNLTSGSATVGAGVTAAVSNAATLELAGSVAARSSGVNRVNIINNSSAAAGILVSGINQVVGAIDGSGNTQVNAGSDLTANHIIQTALIIGGTIGSHGLVTIDASDANGNPLDQPSGFALAGSLAPNAPFGSAGISSANLNDGGESLASGSTLGVGTPGGSTLNSSAAAVPEPATLLLALLGLASLGCLPRRMRK